MVDLVALIGLLVIGAIGAMAAMVFLGCAQQYVVIRRLMKQLRVELENLSRSRAPR